MFLHSKRCYGRKTFYVKSKYC